MNDESKYCLLLDGEDLGEVFDTWELAAHEAELKGIGRWKTRNEFELDWPATIKAVK